MIGPTHAYGGEATGRGRTVTPAWPQGLVEAARPVAGGTLRELRMHRGRTQADLARVLAIGQSDVSRLERRHDLQPSTLHRYADVLGGRLEICVRWPDGELMRLTHPALDL